MRNRIAPRLTSVLLLGALLFGGVLLVLRATPEGLALSDDSIAYIAGARSMLAGNGYREAWLASNGPVTHFPPGYPSALVLLGWFGLDPVRGARFLGAVLFGLNAALLGILGWRMSRLLPAGLILAALFVANASLLRVHTTALSEPLFIFLSLLAFWMFDVYWQRDAHWLWLVATGVLVGAAYLTRYAALALAMTFLVALVVLHRSWQTRWHGAAIFMASFLPWLLGWTIRNARVGGTAANRVFVWHPITSGNLEIGLRTVSEFLMPVESWRQTLYRVSGLFPSIVVAMLAAAVGYVAFRALRREYGTTTSRREVLSFLSALYVLGYLASIVGAMTLFDASTKFKLRILAPIYVHLLILFVAGLAYLWKRRRELSIALAVVALGASVPGSAQAIRELSRGGQGYASFKWYDSQAMDFLRGLPTRVMIYTNEPGAVYLYTDRPGYVLPDRVDPVTAEPRSGFEQGVMVVQTDVNVGRSVLALFAGGDAPVGDMEILSNGLNLIHKSGGAEVYGAAP